MKKIIIGEQKLANNGQLMTIINARSCIDLDVKFEDGTIVKNKTYQAFKNGSIKNPTTCKKQNITAKSRKANKEERLYETNTAKNGQTMKIIEYINSNNITVQFEDNTIVKNRTYSSFKNGSIKNNKCKPEDRTLCKKMANKRIGETNIAHNGLTMTIIKYRSAKDIDIQFNDENNTIVQHVWYNRFLSGNVKHPYAGVDGIRLHKSKKNMDGRIMEIIEYNNANNIKVKFDDNTIIHSNYSLFSKGLIKHPDDKYSNANAHIGETSLANNGQVMTITKYINNRNIEIEFEDGVKKKTNYRYFKQGTVGNRQYSKTKHINEISTATNGQTMKIIEYRKADDIDIQFEDGTIVKNTQYNQFKLGHIHNPKYPIIRRTVQPEKYINKTNKNKEGLNMTVISYRRYTDIDIQFDDGTILYNKRYTDFKSGNIKYPKNK